jgi:hypothetical protein
MTNEKLAAFLQEVRDLLAVAWIPWKMFDFNGGHCQYGCALAVLEKTDILFDFAGAMDYVDRTAQLLHPELRGAVAKRDDSRFAKDKFNSTPAVYVNNHLGKDAILAVYDAAIASLRAPVNDPVDAEVAALCGAVERELEAVGV